jgi:hypothetical protein
LAPGVTPNRGRIVKMGLDIVDNPQGPVAQNQRDYEGYHVEPNTCARQLRVGLLVDSTNVSKYVYDFAKWAQAQSNIRITHLILHQPTGRRSNALNRFVNSTRRLGLCRTIGNILAKVLFVLILKIERVRINKYRRHADHLDEFDLSSFITTTLRITPIISKSGFVWRFDANDIMRVRELDLDLLLRCGSCILRGGILEACALGVLSLHHADNRINRGGPAGFWEVYHRQATTGFSAQRLNEELDGGEVFVRGHFPTREYYLLNQATLFEKANWHLKRLVEKIAASGRMPDALPNVPYSNKLFRYPRAPEAILYLANFFWWLTKKQLRKRFRVTLGWNVAYCNSNWKNCVLWRNAKLENPPRQYLADPFVVSKDGKDFCFVENFDFALQRANIAVYEIKANSSTRIGTALEEKFHLSFPFIFEYGGATYMCPETSENKDIRIYRCLEFPLRWKLEKIVMKGLSAADTMFLEKGGRWWMLTNIDVTGSGDHCSELFIFSSESPFGDTWRPHSCNPVIVDASRARNGGLVRDGDTYYRISQRQGFCVYGKESAINKIIELTESTYIESSVCSITPTFENNIVGTHHLHSNGNITVFDFLRNSRY